MANENTVEVLQDGQLAIATVAQSGTIISGRGDETPFALVSTDEGNQLALKTVNVGKGGGGGGSAPNMKWFTGNVGNTLDISSATGSAYQIYRNGLLLQNGFVQKQHKFLSASSGQYFTITPKLNTSTASKWSFQFMYKTPEYLNKDMRFISNAISDYNTPVLGLNSNDFTIYLGSDGSSWDIASGTSSGDAVKGKTTYNIVFGFSGTEYYVDRAEVGEELERALTLASTQKQYFDASNSVLSFLNTGWNTGYYNDGKFALDTLIITQDDTIIFNGETAVEGTDWTNHNCTITTENYNYPSLAYTQSGDILTFSEPLLATDRICVVSM